MKANIRLSLARALSRPAALLFVLLVAGLYAFFPASRGEAARGFDPRIASSQAVQPRDVARDTCQTAVSINPASLSFTDDSSTVGAANDTDPTVLGCAPGQGPDVVYSFQPAVTDTYTIGVTPMSVNFDVSLYVLTDCSASASACVAGVNENALGKGETLTVELNAGTRYFIVIDSPSPNTSGDFHFRLQRGKPANDTCAAPEVIDASQLPFVTNATTFGAENDLNPGTPCLRSGPSGRGAEVVYQFTSPDTQTYVARVTPVGNYDVSVYIVTNCANLTGCQGADVGGAGVAEEVRRRLDAGVTYFIIVDSFRGEAGDFQLRLEPTIPIGPAAPSNLTATAVSDARVDLQWQDNSNNEAGFRIERSLNGQTFTVIGEAGPNVTSFSDTTTVANTTYFYRVAVFNNFGSANSNVASATTPAPPPPPRPIINVDPAQVDFGTVSSASPQTRTVAVANQGGADLVISAISDPTGAFSLVNKPETPLTVEPNESINLTVRFAPSAAGNFTGSFTITSNDQTRPLVTVQLRGTSTSAPVPNLELTPPALSFEGAATFIVQARNTGDANLIIGSSRGPQAPFSVTSSIAFPATIEPGGSFTLEVRFAPSAPGSYLSQYFLVTNDPDQLLAQLLLRGTSTAENEQLKLKAPSVVTAVAGTTTTFNVIAANGVNSNITLSATPTPGGVFTNLGGGRGTFTYTAPEEPGSNALVTFTARDTANRVRLAQTLIRVLPADETHQVQLSWQMPANTNDPPRNVTVSAGDITPLGGVAPAEAAGLIGYVVYRSTTPNVDATSTSVAVLGPTAVGFTDTAPAPADSGQAFFYAVTALYQSGTESTASQVASSGPIIRGAQFRKKTVRFQAAGSNVAVGAVLVVNGVESFPLIRDGEFLTVEKNTRSTPGNLRMRDIIKPGTTHRIFVRNPNGQTSPAVNVTR